MRVTFPSGFFTRNGLKSKRKMGYPWGGGLSVGVESVAGNGFRRGAAAGKSRPDQVPVSIAPDGSDR